MFRNHVSSWQFYEAIPLSRRPLHSSGQREGKDSIRRLRYIFEKLWLRKYDEPFKIKWRWRLFGNRILTEVGGLSIFKDIYWKSASKFKSQNSTRKFTSPNKLHVDSVFIRSIILLYKAASIDCCTVVS